jgi:hypothetical protein
VATRQRPRKPAKFGEADEFHHLVFSPYPIGSRKRHPMAAIQLRRLLPTRAAAHRPSAIGGKAAPLCQLDYGCETEER